MLSQFSHKAPSGWVPNKQGLACPMGPTHFFLLFFLVQQKMTDGLGFKSRLQIFLTEAKPLMLSKPDFLIPEATMVVSRIA